MVKWEVGDVNGAHSLKDSARLPVHGTIIRDQSPEHVVVTIDVVSPATRYKLTARLHKRPLNGHVLQ